MLTYDTNRQSLLQEPHQDLLRQAYLLTGDPERARQLAERAGGAGRLHAVRYGPADALEYAKAELVRSFVADPGQPPPAPSAGSPVHPDVAMWQALCRLSPRRRAAIVLRYDEALDEEHAAARLGTSPQTVRANVDAALLTLRTAVSGVEDPWLRVASALSAAGRGWSDYTRPAADRVAEVLAAPRPDPVPRAEGVGEPHRSLRPAMIAAAAMAAVLLFAALVVPRLGGDDGSPGPAPAAAAGAAQQLPLGESPRRSVPTQDVPKGLLKWPPRGALATDEALLAAATSAWKAKVAAAEAPATGVSVLWAGALQDDTVVILQALDKSSHPHLAQVDGASDATLRLRHAEPLHPGTQVLSLLPPSGPAGPVRVLVSPEVQLADGLLASNPVSGMPLQPTPVGADGISGVLPSPPGAPTCSRVVLLGQDPTDGSGTGPRVLFSGIMSADMLGGMPAEVEVGNATLAPSADALPETAWFADGKRLAPKVPGKGMLTVAALGPRLAPRRLSAADARIVSSRAYELRRGGGRWIGSVIEVGGKTVCASVFPVGPVSGTRAWALRCPVPGAMMPGLVQVVGGPNVQSVDVALTPTRSPAGQEAHAGSSVRPDGVPIGEAFAALQVVPMGFPCGTGTLKIHRGRDVATVPLPVYIP